MAKLPKKSLIAMAGAAAMKARDYARQNPDKVSKALDRVESTVSTRTHGKYDAKVGKGTGALRKSLGLATPGTTHPAVGSTPPPPAAWDAPPSPSATPPSSTTTPPVPPSSTTPPPPAV